MAVARNTGGRVVESAVGELRPFPRVLLGHYPTPLEPLARFSNQFDRHQLFIKRDDCTGLGLGGNKVRQLEYYLGDALSMGCDAVVSTGALQSNYMRTLAAAASKLGLESHIQLENRVQEATDEYRTSGNRLLTELFGATLYTCPDGRDEQGADEEVRAIAARLTQAGKNPYTIPLAPVQFPKGALGYIEMAAELMAQCASGGVAPDLVVTPSGSGLTHAGTLFGLRLRGNRTPVVGICVRRAADQQHQRIARHCANLARAIGVPNPVVAADIWLDDRALAPGYGQWSEPVGRAIRALATAEGIVVDPVYSGKCMAGLMLLLQSGEIADYRTIVFLHTGGAPALFAYRPHLARLS